VFGFIGLHVPLTSDEGVIKTVAVHLQG